MIKDKLTNASTYFGISENIKEGFEWLKKTDLKNLKDGKYNIKENEIYANVQTYETKKSANFEAHRNYIDIQYIVKGNERIGYTDYSNCKTVEAYDNDKDIEFLECANGEYTLLSEGEFLVLFPQDAHQPSLNNIKKQIVKKVVIKVHI